MDLIAVRRANACGSTNGEPFVTATSAVGKPVRVFGHRGSASRHVDAALAALMAEPRFARILTHRVSLAALPRVLTALAASSTLLGVEYGKAIVDCTVEEDAVALVDGGGGA